MTQRRLASTAILAALALAWLLPAPAAAQDWSAPRTPWGEPDLQGVWDFRTVTPMERPDEFEGQEFLTEEEAAALEQQAVENQVDRPPREGDPGTYNQFWMDFGTNIIGTRRTSLIVDPPDGKIPDLRRRRSGGRRSWRRPARASATTCRGRATGSRTCR